MVLEKQTETYLRQHALSLAAGVVCLMVCFWMITEGSGKLLTHHGFDLFYDGQAESLTHGHWDVSRDAISGEAFLAHGKYYGYFGFTPALPRILLNRAFPSGYGEWSRLVMLLWIASVMLAILAFTDQFGIPSNPFLMAVAILGSTLVFLCSNAITYNEAIMTGAALALWAYYFFWRYLRQPRAAFLAAACVLSFLSFFARLTVGAGPLMLGAFLCAALLFRRVKRVGALLDWMDFSPPSASGAHVAFVAICLGMTAATFLAINHAKFGTWFNPAPYEYHVQYDAVRLARIDGKINHLSNIPFTTVAYFSPGRMQFSRSFPWFGLILTGPWPGSGAKIDWIANYASIPAGMPALTILSVLGFVFAWRVKRWRAMLPILAAAFLAGCLILPNAYIAYRYVHDFYPFLLIGAILGAAAVRSIASKRLRWSTIALIAIAGLWSIGANLAFALKWQREDFGPEPAARSAFLRMRGRMDSLVPIGKLEPIRYNIGDEVKYFRKGSVLNIADPPGTYRYDGEQWEYVSGVPLHLFRLRVKFPRGHVDQRMALWFAGHFGASDAVYVVYLAPTRIQFCFDQWGSSGGCGAPVEIEPGREYRVRIDADRLNSALTVTLDDRKVVEGTVQFHLWSDRDVLLGKSLAPSAHGGEFAGEIRKVEEPQ